MVKIAAGTKCIISHELKPFIVSFKRANIEWKKKYKKYQGQCAQVLSLFGDDTVMLKMHDGKVYKFPEDCIKRSGANRDNLEGLQKEDDTLCYEVTRDKFNSSISSGEVLARERHDCVRPKGPDETHNKQSACLTGSTSATKDYSELREVLAALKLQRYYRTLVLEGFESLNYLKHAKFDDLRAVGMKLGHARRLLQALKEYNANACYNFHAERNLQRRMSFHSSRNSPTSSSSSWYGSSTSRLSLPEYELYASDDLENFQMIDNLATNNSGIFAYRQSQRVLEVGRTRRRRSITSSISESPSIRIWGDKNYLIIPFNKRPLGFNIMSPLNIGTMVSSITNDMLKMKGLCLGLPIIQIMGFDVSRCNAVEVASVLSLMTVPFTVTFGLKPYFEPGQKMMVLKNNKWYPCTVEKMSKSARKVIVKYDNCPLKSNNIEKISDYNRIKHFDEVGVEFPRKTFAEKSDTAQAQMSYCHEAQKQSAISPGGFATKHQSHIIRSKEKLSGERRGNLTEHSYLINTVNKTKHANLKKNKSVVRLSDVV